jgi:SEC-C motif-containing protein
MNHPDRPCPCGSGAAYDACCGRFHRGEPAPTAEALMRSRFSAFALRNAPYLVRTSHPLLRAKLDHRQFRSSFALAWVSLEIVARDAGGPDDREGMVHFRAHYRSPSGTGMLEERSRFVRIHGEWVYESGSAAAGPSDRR